MKRNLKSSLTFRACVAACVAILIAAIVGAGGRKGEGIVYERTVLARSACSSKSIADVEIDGITRDGTRVRLGKTNRIGRAAISISSDISLVLFCKDWYVCSAVDVSNDQFPGELDVVIARWTIR